MEIAKKNQTKRDKFDTLLKTEFPRIHQLSRDGVWSLDTHVKISDRHMHTLSILVYDGIWVLSKLHSDIVHELLNAVKRKVDEKELIVPQDSEPLTGSVDVNMLEKDLTNVNNDVLQHIK